MRKDTDELVRTWCLHHIEIIGEAIARLPDEIRTKYPVAPWREIVAMRNAHIHGYFDVDWEAVWVVVARDIAPLKEAIESILRAEGEQRQEYPPRCRTLDTGCEVNLRTEDLWQLVPGEIAGFNQRGSGGSSAIPISPARYFRAGRTSPPSAWSRSNWNRRGSGSRRTNIGGEKANPWRTGRCRSSRARRVRLSKWSK